MVRTSPAPGGSGRETDSERGQLAFEKLEVLILARLSVTGQRPISGAQVSRSLQPVLARRLTPNEWRESCARAVSSLRQAAQIEPERLVLTAAGADRLKAALRLRSAPKAKD